MPERPSQSERWARFSREGLRVEVDDGTSLPLQVKLIEPRTRIDRLGSSANRVNPQTGAPLPAPPKDKRVIYAELFYAFQRRPEYIRLTPPKDVHGALSATIGFIAFHKRVQVIDFRFLSDTVQLNLDWGDPWYSAFSNPNLTRHHKDALMGFMYVSPRTIRIEALVRLRDLKLWNDQLVSIKPNLSVGEQAEVLAEAANYVNSVNSVMVNGSELTAVSNRANFVEISNRGINIVDTKVPLDSSTAMIGTVSVFNIDELPREVLLNWQLYA
ncbi:MAG: hypothetical protein ACR2O8_07095, partial [Rhizobiaceae bacterium]